MKKLLSCILVLVFVFSAGSALAGMSLYDMWHDYTFDEPGYGGKRSSADGSDRRVEGHRVGEITDWMMDYSSLRYGGDLRDMLIAWTESTEVIELPFFEALVRRIGDVDIELVRSEFYNFRSDGESSGEAELYMMEIGVDLPSGREKYTVLVCLQLGNYTAEAAEYVVVSGDLDALGVEEPIASLNYLGDMFVYFCDEWVSLRETPSTKADRITKVPKYDVVENCFHSDGAFVRCEYNGREGFILWEYLSPMEYMDYALSH